MKSPHTLHEVLLNSTSGSHDAVNHSVLSQVTDDFPNSARRHVGGIPQKDSAPHLSSVGWVAGLLVIPFIERFMGEAPIDHLVDDFDGSVEVGGLESHGGIALEEFGVVNSLVEVIAVDLC